MILNFHDRLDRVLNVTKSRQDNYVIDNIGIVYFKIETKLSGPIWLGAVCKENQTRQRHDWLYRFGRCWNRIWTVRTYLIGCNLWWKLDWTTIWLIVLVRSMSKTILNFHNRLDQVQYVMKIREDNNVIDHTGGIYAKKYIELLWSIESSADFD